MQSRTNGTDRDIQDERDLFICEVFDIAEQDDCSEVDGHRIDGMGYLIANEVIEHLLPQIKIGIWSSGLLFFVDLADLFVVHLHRLTLLAPVFIDKGVFEDLEQPGFGIGAPVILPDKPVCLHIGVLHQIVGGIIVQREVESKGVQRINMREKFFLEDGMLFSGGEWEVFWDFSQNRSVLTIWGPYLEGRLGIGAPESSDQADHIWICTELRGDIK